MAHGWYSVNPKGIRQGQGASLSTGCVWAFPACKEWPVLKCNEESSWRCWLRPLSWLGVAAISISVFSPAYWKCVNMTLKLSDFWANTCHLSNTKCQTSARHQTTTLLQHLPHLLCPLLNSFTDLFCLALFIVLDLRIGCWERESLSILGPNHFE